MQDRNEKSDKDITTIKKFQKAEILELKVQ